jgi:D-glycero-D-manno-heptose 1,7-bisphosphate phosphatase
MEKSKLLILDRDGVINQDSDDFIKFPEEWQAIPGSLEAIARLCREDYRVVVITNQSGISRGYFSINTLNRIHQKMMDELNHLGGEISAIFFCPHSDADNCSCRKPQPGMFVELVERTKCNLKDVYAVGDSLRDLQAASAAGAKPVLVRTGKGEKTLELIQQASDSGDELTDELTSDGHDLLQLNQLADVPVYADLGSFVDELLRVSVRVESAG